MRMRSLLAVATLATCSAGAAMAADLPMRTAAPAPYIPAPPIFTWTGFYAGVNAGYVFNDTSRFNTSNTTTAFGVPLSRPGSVNVDSDGFTAGGQIGYNYQFGAGNGIVVGVEADAAYTDLGQTNTYTLNNRANRFHQDMDFLGTVRGRVGYAFDRFMVYGTGGFAYGDVNQQARFFDPAGTLSFSGGRSNIQTGYAYGGGIEYAMPTESFLNFFHSSAVTVKAEYLHYDLGTQNFAVAATGLTGATGSYNERVRTDGDLARIGLNYKF